jgi:hypothetical protein
MSLMQLYDSLQNFEMVKISSTANIYSPTISEKAKKKNIERSLKYFIMQRI